jgi:hypothetical protein
MNKQLHTNHSNHLKDLKTQHRRATAALTLDRIYSEKECEEISQKRAITEMMFENGMKAFINPLSTVNKPI